jgi:dolichol-phosphate mannosyltransferase
MIKDFMSRQGKDVSVVLPVCNEAKNLETACDSITTTLKQLGLSYEIIFVEGGSRDGSFDILCDLKNKFDQLVVIGLKKRYGQSIALSVGIYLSKGEIIITMDSDLQNTPQDLPCFIKETKNGHDVVCGWRRIRRDPGRARIYISKIGNRALSGLSGIRMHDFTCTFKSYTREAAKQIGLKLHPGLHRFIPLIARQLGLSMLEIEIEHRSRTYGRSKYSLFKVFKAFLDYLVLRMHKGTVEDITEEKLLKYIKTVR